MVMWAQIRELDAERESLDVQQMGGGYGYGGYGCGFGTQDAGAEGDWLPVVLGEESYFFGGPSAFRAYGEGCVCFLIRGPGVA